MKDELEEHQEDYWSFNYEDWCDLLYKTEVKDEMKREATQINNLASDREDSLSDSGESVSITRKKKARTGIMCYNKGPHENSDKHLGTQTNCVICKKSGMPERKYMLHLAKDCVGVRACQPDHQGWNERICGK